MLKTFFIKLKGSTAPKSYTLCLELMIDLKCCPLPKIARPIWKGYNILGAMVIHIALQSLPFKTQVD